MEFEVNLLPHKSYTAWLETLKKSRLIILLLVLGVSFVLLLGIHAKVITKKTSQMVTSGQEFLKITLEKEKVSSLVKLLSQLKDKRIIWTDKLISLSEATPDRVFLTAMEFEKAKSGAGVRRGEEKRDKLVLQGVVVASTDEDPAFFIQKFMKDLKNNLSFMSGFEDPVLVSVSNSRKEDQKVSLDFEFCLFRKVKE